MDLYTLMADNAFILEKSIAIMLAELQDMEIFKKVTMNIKVVEVKDPVELASRTKHDVTVADSIGHCKGGRAHGNYSSSMHGRVVYIQLQHSPYKFPVEKIHLMRRGFGLEDHP